MGRRAARYYFCMTQPQPDSALVLFSHGSLLCGAGRALAAHAQRLRATGEWRAVEPGYLNYDAPSFADAVRAVVSRTGARRVVVLPYFLVAGRFVTRDLRQCMVDVCAAWPGVEFVVADPIGHSPLLADAVTRLAEAARPLAPTHADDRARPDFCEGKPECPLRQAGLCDGTRAAGNAASAAPAPVTAATPPLRPTALLLLAHGSPRAGANRDVERVADDLRAAGRFGIVRTGYLDCDQPDIPTAADACVTDGARAVLAAPFFLHTGRHVALDIPALLAEAAGRHPAVDFRMARFLGSAPEIAQLLLLRARSSTRGQRPAC